MDSNANKPIYDLEERTFQFATSIRLWIKTLPKTIANTENAKQLVRSSGSVGANYIETNESRSKKRFCFQNKNLFERGKRINILDSLNR